MSVFRYSVDSLESFLDDLPKENHGKANDDSSIGSIDVLPYAIKQLIKSGAEKGSRSEAIGSVLGAMIYAGVPELDIFRCFENEAIGEKYREKGSGRKKWLIDEIARMRDFVKSNNNGPANEKAAQNELNEIENRIWHKWPKLDNSAMAGFAGRFVELATRKSEADPAAVLLTFLMRFGVEVGNGPFLYVGDGKHYARSIAVVVGSSSKARKGTSSKPVSRLFSMGLMPDMEIYVPATVSPGPLSSGEGLIYAVRDKVEIWKTDKKTGEGETVVVDPGVDDKRLFVLDEEFAGCLTAGKREGNTLTTIIRCLWDNGNLAPLTKNNRTQATGAHIGIVSHITLQELNKKLEDTEAFSGFANRILWVCARRQGLVPFPKPMDQTDLGLLQRELKKIVKECRSFGEMELSSDAESTWADVYAELSKDNNGLVGSCINRAESQTLRLAMVYALLDSSRTINVDHLRSALAVWKYCEDSARFIFAGREINPYAEKILDLLRTGDKSTRDIYDAFSRNITKKAMEEALSELLSQKKIEIETTKQTGRGRPKTMFKCVDNDLDLSF